MGSRRQLHVLFFPLLESGHVIPMIDIAKLFASRGVKSTFLTTAAYAPLVEAAASGSIHLHLLPFRSPESGQDHHSAFFKSLPLLRPPFEKALRALHPVDALLSDVFFPWTTDAAEELGIPRLTFYGTGLFALCCFGVVHRHRLHESAGETIVFPPGFPHKVELPRSQITKEFAALVAEHVAAQARSYGVLVNSFRELEPGYGQYYREVLGCNNWVIGPVSLCNEGTGDISARGTRDPTNPELILQWLDSRRARSVLYICFGSVTTIEATQLKEMALCLKQADHPFMWVIKEKDSPIDGLMTEELEEKGLIIRGWAPQILILNHKAVGGFVTHCGWNSCLEGISAGVPLVAWPNFGDQFYNQKLVVEVLGVGVGVDVKQRATGVEGRAVVKAEEIRRAVDGVMNGGDEAEGMRRRVGELSMMGKRAMEPGGSSYEDLDRLIDELISTSKKRNC